MWMVNPKIMCNQHLIGEHLELHMFIGSIKKNISMQGYLKNNLLEPNSLYARHNELVKEIIYRGMNHKSDLDSLADADEWERIYLMLRSEFDVEEGSGDEEEVRTIFNLVY
jgi:hypothetical protein